MKRAASTAITTILVSLALLCVWGTPYIPTNDGPQHIYSSHVENNYGAPGTLFHEFLVPSPQLASRGFALLFGPLEALFPWNIALQITETVMIGLLVAGLWVLARCLHPARGRVAILAMVLPLGWVFYMGFFRFVIGQYFGLFVLGVFLRIERPRPWQIAALSGLLLLQAYMHLFTALVSGLVCGVIILVRDRGVPLKLKRLGQLALASIPVFVIFWITNQDDAVTIGAEAALGTRWPTWERVSSDLPYLIAPGPPWRTLLVLVLVGIGLVAGGRAAFLEKNREQIAIFLSALLLLVLGLLAPMDIPGWQFVSPRFFGTATFLAIALIPLERWGRLPSIRVKRLVAIVPPVIAATGLLASWLLHRQLYDECAPAFSQLKEFGGPGTSRDSGFKLASSFEGACGGTESVPYVQPYLHAGALFTASEGGFFPFLFVGATGVHAFVPRPSNEIPLSIKAPPVPGLELWTFDGSSESEDDAKTRDRRLVSLANYGALYNELLVFGARPSDFVRFEELGFVWERRSHDFGSAVFEGCSLSVEVRPPELDGPLTIQFESKDGIAPPVTKSLPPAPRNLPRVAVALPKRLCGAYRLRVRDARGLVCDSELGLNRGAHTARCTRGEAQSAP